jgi:hypothetical protein
MKRYGLKYGNLYLQVEYEGGYFLVKKEEITQFVIKCDLDLLLEEFPIEIENYPNLQLDVNDFDIEEFEINEII